MPVVEPTWIDSRAFLAIQRQERYKARVLHSPPEKDAARRQFIRRLVAAEQGVAVDVLAQVAANPEQAATVDLLDEGFLRQTALDAAARGAGLVVVEEFEFLLPVWGNDLSGLQQMITTLSRTDTPSVIVFAMQTCRTLETWSLLNDQGQSRILALSSIQSLG
jgi:hypothetical protein